MRNGGNSMSGNKPFSIASLREFSRIKAMRSLNVKGYFHTVFYC